MPPKTVSRWPRHRSPSRFTALGWVYEEKVDGWRFLAYKDAAGVRLVSRNAKDLTRRFPGLVAAVAALMPPTLLLDGEIAVFDSQLISHFEWVRAQPMDEPATPPTVIAFDCLEAWARVLERGYEGLVGKDEASPYVEGRMLSWLKVKVPKYRAGERGWDPK